MNNNLKIITEHVDMQSLEFISEGEGDNKILKIRGPFMQAELLNQNKRIYSEATCDRETDKFIKLPEYKRLGEFLHPPSPEINRERACIVVENFNKDGKNYIGTAKVLTSFPCGRIVSESLKNKWPTGISSRGLGKVNESTRRVDDSYALITYDIVPTPSGPDCWIEGILEGKEYIINGDMIVEQAVANLQKKLDRNGSKEISRYLKEFIKSIK